MYTLCKSQSTLLLHVLLYGKVTPFNYTLHVQKLCRMSRNVATVIILYKYICFNKAKFWGRSYVFIRLIHITQGKKHLFGTKNFLKENQ